MGLEPVVGPMGLDREHGFYAGQDIVPVGMTGPDRSRQDWG